MDEQDTYDCIITIKKELEKLSKEELIKYNINLSPTKNEILLWYRIRELEEILDYNNIKH